jgi:hypothetical protein
MTWRGSSSYSDRIFSALAYLLPMYYAVIQFSGAFFNRLPELQILTLPLIPIAFIYNIVPLGLGSLVVFIVLFAAVVRNPKVNHMIRFNVMQAILMDILLFLLSLVWQLFGRILPSGLVVDSLTNCIFLGAIGVSFYCVYRSVVGQYAEIPSISDVTYQYVGN